MVVIKLFCLVKSQKLLSKMWLYSIHDVIVTATIKLISLRFHEQN